MLSFAVEAYASGVTPGDLAKLAARAREATEAVKTEGLRVRYLNSIFMPADEICLHLFEGPSAEAIGEVTGRAGLAFERVIEALIEHGTTVSEGIDQGGE